MSARRRTAAVALLALPLALGACGAGSSRDSEMNGAAVARIGATNMYRITLTPVGARRLGLQTAAVARRGGSSVIPYSALLYSPTGKTWTYVASGPLTFVRRAVVVDRIDRGRVFLASGPPMGTRVATVGVDELHGLELAAGGGR